MTTNYETNVEIKKFLDRTADDLRRLHHLVEAASPGSIPPNLVVRTQSLEIRATALYRKMLERQQS